MEWRKVREHYPDQWLVIEATRAHSEDNHRIVEDVAVVDSFPNGTEAWNAYQSMHKQRPDREYIPIHTSRETLEFEEIAWLGLRPGR